jgi:hypothetical protein
MRTKWDRLESALGHAIGDVVRDTGHVMFCTGCRRAEMPGAIECSKCGRPLVRAEAVLERKRAKKAQTTRLTGNSPLGCATGFGS